MLVRILATAVRKFPQFNASIDTERGEIVYKKYVNIGVAVDTDRGLLVPVIRNADEKNITQIAVELHQLAERARERKLTLDEMSGGSISDLEPWRHWRHVFHADRELARSGDPRRLARRRSSRSGETTGSSRRSVFRSRSPTITA